MSARIKIIDNDISKVIASVSLSLNIPIEKIKGNYRGKDEAAARHIAMGLVFKRNQIGLQKIGEIFNRNHATVIYGIKKFNNVLENPKRDKFIADKIDKVMEALSLKKQVITCSYCNKQSLRYESKISEAVNNNLNLYCNKECSYLGRRVRPVLIRSKRIGVARKLNDSQTELLKIRHQQGSKVNELIQIFKISRTSVYKYLK